MALPAGADPSSLARAARHSRLAGAVQLLMKRSADRSSVDSLRESLRWGDARLALHGIVRLCEENGVRFVPFLYTSPEMMDRSTSLALYAEELAAMDIPFYMVPDDLLTDRGLRNSMVDRHPNAAGHALIAERMAAVLESSFE